MSNGRFGIHGGQYIPETLMNAVHEWRNDFPTVSTRSSAKLQYE